MSVGMLALAAAVLAASWALTGVVLRYARARLLDLPNERSSHAAPTPRGGGLAIVLAFVAGLIGAALAGWVPVPLALALGGGTAAVAAVGWVDDHQHVAARWRAAVHLGAALWALFWVGGMPVVRLGVADASPGLFGWVLGVLGIMWVVNLFNFMDGIDGIAAGQAVLVGAAGALLAGVGSGSGVGPAALLLAAAAAGFLVWNRPPARIFMGDVGSGALGYVIVVTALASENTGGPPVLAWGVLMGVFLVDATATLVRRVARGERFFEAHRTHAYQRAVQAGHSHGRVTGAVLAIGVALAGLAALMVHRPSLTLPMSIASTLLLLAGYRAVDRLRPMPPPTLTPRPQENRPHTESAESTEFSRAGSSAPRSGTDSAKEGLTRSQRR